MGEIAGCLSSRFGYVAFVGWVRLAWFKGACGWGCVMDCLLWVWVLIACFC